MLCMFLVCIKNIYEIEFLLVVFLFSSVCVTFLFSKEFYCRHFFMCFHANSMWMLCDPSGWMGRRAQGWRWVQCCVCGGFNAWRVRLSVTISLFKLHYTLWQISVRKWWCCFFCCGFEENELRLIDMQCITLKLLNLSGILIEIRTEKNVIGDYAT